MENRLSNGRNAIEEELIKGLDIANQLLEILVHKSNTHGGNIEGPMPPFVEDLVRKVQCSFTNTLLLLNFNNDISYKVVMPITIKDVPSSVKLPKPQDTDEAKNRRGCYKRRSSAPTWETNSSILMEDGYVWRKYGQKITTNAKYLRNYYRCTHKYDEDCPAIKQVQRIQEDPPLYRTTYYGRHNCKSSLCPEIMLEPASSSDSSMFLSFSNTFPSKEEYPFSSSLSSSTKQEPMEVILADHTVDNQFPSSDYLLLCDCELDFNYSRHVTMLSSTQSVQFDSGSGLNFDG
ncbi:putative WRKY transcription factor 70, partial [Mucuna pruriens]